MLKKANGKKEMHEPSSATPTWLHLHTIGSIMIDFIDTKGVLNDESPSILRHTYLAYGLPHCLTYLRSMRYLSNKWSETVLHG